MIVNVIIFALAIANIDRTNRAESNSIALDATIAIVLCAALVVNARPQRGSIGFTRIFLALYSVFHLGIIWPLPFGQSPNFANAADSKWFHSNALPGALSVVAAFAALTALSSKILQRLLNARRIGEERPLPTAETLGEDSKTNREIGEIATVVVILSILAWFAISVLSGGLSSGANYLTYLDSTSGSALPWIYLLMGASMGVAGVGTPFSPNYEKALVAAYVFFAAIAFPLGLRGEVLIPAMAYLATRSRTQYSRLYKWAFPIGIVSMSLGALVAKTRLDRASISVHDANPLNALTELGYSLRPLLFVEEWKNSFPGARTGLETYFNPILRTLDPLGLTGVQPAAADQSAFNVFVGDRYGQIGGSILAEAYWSGGLLGAAVIAIIVGAALGWSDSLDKSPYLQALTGAIAFVLLLWVRNSFTPVPGQLAVCMLFTFGLWLMTQAFQARTTTSSMSRRDSEQRNAQVNPEL